MFDDDKLDEFCKYNSLEDDRERREVKFHEREQAVSSARRCRMHERLIRLASTLIIVL